MREILFRGKRDNKDEWVCGYLGVFKDITQIFVPFTEEEEKENEGHFFSAIGGLWHTVIPETVGQYTGLTDRNGEKIFEGDIVKEEYEVFVSARTKEKRIRIGYVEYSSSPLCCGYYAYFWNDKEKWRGNFGIHHCCEVIGNIHDNPELLKGGETNA